MLAKIAKLFDGSHIDNLTDPGYKTVMLLIDEGYGNIDVFRCFKYINTWIEWEGAAPCPIPDKNILHEVKFRGGSVLEGYTPESWDWFHFGEATPVDIVAYRVLE